MHCPGMLPMCMLAQMPIGVWPGALQQASSLAGRVAESDRRPCGAATDARSKASPALQITGMEAQQAGPAPIPVQQVFATLEAALSVDNATRAAAEAQLREWEGDAAPGFIGSLLKVVAEVQAVPEVRAAAAAAWPVGILPSSNLGGQTPYAANSH